MKKVISVILINILLLSILTNQIMAYSGDDYSVDIPSGYEEVSEGSFYDGKGSSILFELEDAGRIKYDKDEIYTKENFDKIITEICNKMYYDVKITIVEKDITRFTENEYECFMFVLKLDVSGMEHYVKYYFSIDDDKIFGLTITSFDYEYFDSVEIEKMIDSLTIDDFIGRKQEIEKIWEKVFLVGGILIGLIILYGIYNKAREKTLYEKTQMIMQKQALAKKQAERELKRNLNIKEDVKSDIKSFSVENDNDNISGFSTKHPNSTNGSFDIRDNEKKTISNFSTAEEKKIEKKVCPNCGQENDGFWIFCNQCGHKLSEE